MKYPRIETERLRLGMTKKAFSAAIGTTTKTYNHFITGEGELCYRHLAALRSLTGKSLDFLLDRHGYTA